MVHQLDLFSNEDFNSKITPIRLNLGCGSKKMKGFLNLDIREELSPDIIDDVRKTKDYRK